MFRGGAIFYIIFVGCMFSTDSAVIGCWIPYSRSEGSEQWSKTSFYRAFSWRTYYERTFSLKTYFTFKSFSTFSSILQGLKKSPSCEGVRTTVHSNIYADFLCVAAVDFSLSFIPWCPLCQELAGWGQSGGCALHFSYIIRDPCDIIPKKIARYWFKRLAIPKKFHLVTLSLQ